MKKLFTIAALILLSCSLFAQVPPTPAPAVIPPASNTRGASGIVPPPLLSREVSGIVKDASGQTVIGALVTLKSRKDTLRTATNDDGIFIFKDVKLATFNITVSSIGSVDFIKKYLTNDATKRVILDPILLKDKTNELNEVKINGTPSITYKTDTVEYRASDYHVRENATLDELLKKMEGMEVGSDGTLTHQGQQVTKMRVNGKDFAGGDVAQGIQNLPADIVEKAQVIDDYGDQAGRTGIKDGDPTKVLNVTTYANKSVGNIVRATTSVGTNDRYNENIFAERLNGNEQLGIIGNFRNTVNGVASSGISAGNTGAAGGPGGGGGGGGVGSSAGSGGTTTSGSPSFNYRDQWGKYLQVNGSYRYTYTNTNSISDQTGVQSSTLGSSNFATKSNSQTNNKTHNTSFEFEYTPDSSNFLRVTPTFSYSSTNQTTNRTTSLIGLQNQSIVDNPVTTSTNPSYGAIVFYQYIFKKDHRRNISLQLNATHSNSQQDAITNNETRYLDGSQNLLKDSLTHRNTTTGSTNNTYRASLQYVEPLTRISQLEFAAQTQDVERDNDKEAYNINPNGSTTNVDSLNNIYKTTFITSRVALNYRLNTTKFSLSLGAAAMPSHLDGTNISKGGIVTEKNDFHLVPLFRFQYQFSRTHQISINYTGTPQEPNFASLQPVPDYSNPNNPVFGNPDLRPSFRHNLALRYNNYLPNSRWNFSANVSGSYYQDQIEVNSIQLYRPALKDYLNETYYVNLSGNESILTNYNISKQFSDRRYNLTLNGTTTYNYEPGMSNNVLTRQTTWDFYERFGPRLNPNTSLEINPFVSYEVKRNFNTLPNASTSNYTRTALDLEGKFYLGGNRSWTIEYDASKNYLNGIAANVTKNPLVINAYIEKEFFKRKNGQLRISAFDLLDQNNYVDRTYQGAGYTDTKTNALSRYFMVSFILNLQKWSGTPTRNGQQMMRRGDGSFIY